MKHRPSSLSIQPLWLREKLFWKIYANKNDSKYFHLYENVNLELARDVFMKLMPTDIGHKQIAFCGFYELSVSLQIAKLAKAGGLMIDVGANYGYYSCLWAALGINNQVLAFEASPRNSSALKLNIMQNRLANKIHVHETAVGKENGYLFFELGPEEQSGWGGLIIGKRSDAVEVPVISLDEMLYHRDEQQISVLKIDTEGADTWVIQGAEKLLTARRINHIFFEENLVRMKNINVLPGEAQKLLKNCGYSLKKIGLNEWYAWL